MNQNNFKAGREMRRSSISFFELALQPACIAPLMWKLNEFTRVDNIFDERYVGSVIVNASNGQYYEPAPETNYTAGVSVSHQF